MDTLLTTLFLVDVALVMLVIYYVGRTIDEIIREALEEKRSKRRYHKKYHDLRK